MTDLNPVDPQRYAWLVPQEDSLAAGYIMKHK